MLKDYSLTSGGLYKALANHIRSLHYKCNLCDFIAPDKSFKEDHCQKQHVISHGTQIQKEIEKMSKKLLKKKCEKCIFVLRGKVLRCKVCNFRDSEALEEIKEIQKEKENADRGKYFAERAQTFHGMPHGRIFSF